MKIVLTFDTPFNVAEAYVYFDKKTFRDTIDSVIQ